MCNRAVRIKMNLFAKLLKTAVTELASVASLGSRFVGIVCQGMTADRETNRIPTEHL